MLSGGQTGEIRGMDRSYNGGWTDDSGQTSGIRGFGQAILGGRTGAMEERNDIGHLDMDM